MPYVNPNQQWQENVAPTTGGTYNPPSTSSPSSSSITSQAYPAMGGLVDGIVDVVPNYTAPKTLSSANLAAPDTTMTVPPAPTPTQPQTYQSIIGSIPSLDSLMQQYNQPTAADTQQSDIQSRLLNLTSKLGGRQQAQATAEQQAGLPGMNQQLTDVNGQIQALQKEALSIPLQIQQDATGRGVTAGGVAPIQTAQLRQNAIKSLGLSSIAQTLQGNIALAQQQANRAVDLQFEPMQQELDTLKTAYQLNKDNLDRTDKQRSQALQVQLAERQRLLDNAKEDQKTTMSFIAEAAKNGAPSVLLNQAQGLQPQAALSMLSQYMSDPIAKQQALLDMQMKQEQLKEQPTAFATDQALKNAQIANANANTANTRANTKKTLADLQGGGNADPTVVSGWVTAIRNGTAKVSDLTGNPSLKNAVIASLGQGGSSETDMVGTSLNSLAELQTLMNRNQGFSGAVGAKGISSLFGFYKQPIAGTNAANFDNKLKQVKNDVILPNLNLLHGLGRVTDREFQALTSAVTSLDTNLPESEFKKELNNITSSIAQKAQGLGIDMPEPTDHAQGSTWIRSDGTYVSDGRQWVKQ